MVKIYNGMGATGLGTLGWQKSRRSGARGNCVELARISSDEIGVRNSRFPDGPVLVYTQAEIEALIMGAKDGDFDNFLG
jgi:hypothetical protein